MKKPTGYILYEGPSQLDGAPIVVIATIKSKNVKTSSMVQTWILRSDVSPIEAVQTGQDSSICGDCPHKLTNNKTCYVLVWQAPTNIWKAYKRGNYPHMATGREFAGRMVRLGAYGDPAAVPVNVWEKVTKFAKAYTGYTHQWRTADSKLSQFCMASCDVPQEREMAKTLNYRTFRIRLATEEMQNGEVSCPASKEAGHKLTCEECGHCNGHMDTRKGDVTIIVHGAVEKINKYAKMRTAI